MEGSSQQGNNTKKGQGTDYEQWTQEESEALLTILVEAINNGMRDSNGSLAKKNVDRYILPRLNVKIKSPKTYGHYTSRMKWFKRKYEKMSMLMRNNSGFGWDRKSCTFTASDEVWDDYLKVSLVHSLLNCSFKHDLL